jgi:DNA-binding transcriptional ArsR family regulator
VEIVTHGQVLARFGHALSDPIRARLLLALREAPGYPADLAELLGTSRQNLSNHLACLRGCGLVVAVPEGRRTRYELAEPTRWATCSAWCWRWTRPPAPTPTPRAAAADGWLAGEWPAGAGVDPAAGGHRFT